MTTTPLAKAITTTEGIVVILSDVVLGAAASINPHVLSPKIAAIVVGAQHIALLAQRGVIKAKALQTLPPVEKVVDSSDPLGQLAKEVEAAAGGPVTE